MLLLPNGDDLRQILSKVIGWVLLQLILDFAENSKKMIRGYVLHLKTYDNIAYLKPMNRCMCLCVCSYIEINRGACLNCRQGEEAISEHARCPDNATVGWHFALQNHAKLLQLLQDGLSSISSSSLQCCAASCLLPGG